MASRWPHEWPQESRELDTREKPSSVPGRILDALRRHTVAALALFLALAGSSYAAVTLGPGSVGSREIANHGVEEEDLARGAVTTMKIAPNAVTPSRIAPNAVNSDDVEDGSLTLEDFRRGQVPRGDAGERGSQGSAGLPGSRGDTRARQRTGPQGTVGPQGVPGPPGAAGSGPSGGRSDSAQLHAANRNIRRIRGDQRDGRLHDHLRRESFHEHPDSHVDADQRCRWQPDLDLAAVLEPELDCELHVRIVPTPSPQLHRRSAGSVTGARARGPCDPALSPIQSTPNVAASSIRRRTRPAPRRAGCRCTGSHSVARSCAGFDADTPLV